ncbi:MAG: Transcription factor TFIIIB component B [Claussenomyces sp. TS43310]|nr:MAG: Transcription factor TFIIIB component B [Claussenomyces sp. TS43310]
MSSMIKKKGTLSFKPKVPGIRRTVGPATPSTTSSSAPQQSIERQSQTSAPAVRAPSAATSTSPTTASHSQNEESLQQITASSATEPIAQSVSASIQSVPLNPDDQLFLAETPRSSATGKISATPSQPAAQIPQDDLPTNPTAAAIHSESVGGHDLVSSAKVATRTDHTVTPTVPQPQIEPCVDTSGVQDVSETSGSVSHTNDAAAQELPITSNSIEAVSQPSDEAPNSSPAVGSSQAHAGSSHAAITSEDVDISTMGAGESARASQLVPLAPLHPDGTSGADIMTGSNAVTNRLTKRRRINEPYDDIRPTIEVDIHKRRRVHLGPKQPRKPRNKDVVKKPRKRAETPEDAEEQEVDRTTIKMAELCKDIKIGRKFSKHAEIKQREVEQRMKAKIAKDNPDLSAIEENRHGGTKEAEQQDDVVGSSSGVQMRLVNGQIVLDDRSLIVDRHARAAAVAEDMEEVEENEFTKVTTSGTHMKRERAIVWDYESEEKFYTGLRMFGTDFEMISKMFPDRNRRQIKLKFNKEERAHPKKIEKALIGERTAIDLDQYKSHTGLEYEDTRVINDEYRKVEEEHAAEQAEKEARAAEEIRQKKAAIQGTSGRRLIDGPAGTDSAKENEPEGHDGKASAASKSRKKGAGKKKRNLHSVRGGGEEVEVLGAI